jgi:hypothetical protein
MNSFFDNEDTIDLRSIVNQYIMPPFNHDNIYSNDNEIPYFTDNDEDYDEEDYPSDIIIQPSSSDPNMLNQNCSSPPNAIILNENNPSPPNAIILNESNPSLQSIINSPSLQPIINSLSLQPIILNQSNPQPIISNPQPIILNESNLQPIILNQSNPEPIISNLQPIISNLQPIISNPQPIISNLQPIISNPSPQPVLDQFTNKELFHRILNEYQNQRKESYLKYPLENNINLGERDNILQEIQKQIQSKRQFLTKKQIELKDNIKTNDFLRQVKDDYNRYHSVIQKERKEQFDALNTLKQYSEDLRKNTEMTEDKLKDSIRDQQYIVNEMNALKKTLDEYTCP